MFFTPFQKGFCNPAELMFCSKREKDLVLPRIFVMENLMFYMLNPYVLDVEIVSLVLELGTFLNLVRTSFTVQVEKPFLRKRPV